MKQIFNATGVAIVQADQLSLSVVERATSMQELQNNFAVWMNDHFILTATQQQQIDAIPAPFVEELTSAIAYEMNIGNTITFAKEDPADGKKDKDILMSYATLQRLSFGTAAIQKTRTLQILIHYR
ncbi:hypothetical protein [Sphingobacterium sp. SYP-B4668]|uniref:hypothetical protein n=1 Tax=Sphingobacterium sp. SYP-B4668 TaxID=2996035 RepID=UPI0022DE5AE0|nr:hypothetical protein [Sphingobacterium sp. SYP-B4668]